MRNLSIIHKEILKEANAFNKIKKLMDDKNLSTFELLEAIEKTIQEASND